MTLKGLGRLELPLEVVYCLVRRRNASESIKPYFARQQDIHDHSISASESISVYYSRRRDEPNIQASRLHATPRYATDSQPDPQFLL
jgi:hypothetical protein